ncbi:MAG: hypothetical protein OXR84_15730 [Magnetovibrio sp.]|nr:hypothetical protein [Magnetovibrio sp.]
MRFPKSSGGPDEDANAVVSPASPAAGFIGGANLIVGGAAMSLVQI